MSTTTPTPSAEATQPATVQSVPDPSSATGTCCGRRAVLRAAGLVALSGGAVALAACSADTSTTAPESTPSAAGTSPEASSAAPSPSATSASASAAESSAAAPEGTAVPVSEVAVGGGVVVDEKYVVTQPTEGEFKAFSAICTHQGCPVGSVEDGVIICPCHNSHFDITTGDPVEGPAAEPLPSAKITQSGDSVYVTG